MTNIELIQKKIYIIRDEKVILDSDLAQLYGVETKRLNEQVKRNIDRFPDKFSFQLTKEEFDILKSQNATSRWGGVRKLPFAFTEHGALMVSTILNSKQAIKMSIFIIEAFVKIREMISSHKEILKRLEAIERKVGGHDKTIQQIIDAIKQLMMPEIKSKKKIGF